MNILAGDLEALAMRRNQAEDESQGEDATWLPTLINRLTVAVQERDIQLHLLPHFLQQRVYAETGGLERVGSGESLERIKSALERIIAEQQRLVGPYAVANPSINSPLSKPEFEALKNLVDFQASNTVGQRWADYHLALLHSETVRQLTVTSGAISALLVRARDAEAKVQQTKDRMQAEAARQHAKQQAEKAALAIAQRQAEEAALKATFKREAQATVKAIFASPVTTTATQGEAGRLADEISLALKTLTLAKPFGPSLAIFATGMGFPSSLAKGERPTPVVTTPLSQLGLPSNLDLTYLANSKGTADVSHRAVFDTASESKPSWIQTAGPGTPGGVRVRHVRYNAANNTYEFIRDGEDQPALIWTPISQSGSSSTTSPATPPELPSIPGFPATPIEADLEIYPEVAEQGWDDYILIFPIDSGWENQYVMFRDPRKIPGSASGYGKPITGNWLNGETSGNGAPIPSKIADQLRGRNFSSFGKQREAIWKAVANNPELGKLFGRLDLDEMNKGYAPFAPNSEQRGPRVKYEIHHLLPIKDGGEVYDMDNFSIMTPTSHIETHRREQPL